MQIIDIINKAEKENKTCFAFELLPPLKGDGLANVYQAIDPLMEFNPSYINVTYHREDVKYVEHPNGLLEKRIVRHRPGTVGTSAAIMKKYGVEVVPHLICGGLSRYDIEDALIDMDFLGINNVLALRGDCLQGEKVFNAHAQGHKHAHELVSQISDMNKGIFIDGEVKDSHHSKFCIGVAGYPEKHSESPNFKNDLNYLKKKVDAGASYIITQMSFDNKKILSFIKDCRAIGINVPIIPGIKPLSTKSHLNLLPQIFHVDLPEELVIEANKCTDNKAVRQLGVEWAIAQSKELMSAGVPVLHYYSMGKTDNIAKIAKAVF
ncbi:MAG: methylenetetrahydrofolate reductase [Rikenellaceae bacterium]